MGCHGPGERADKAGETLREGVQARAPLQYLLFKSPEKWTESQKTRARLLFDIYPDIAQAYSLSHKLRLIYSKTKTKGVAYTKLARWFNEVQKSGIDTFRTIEETIYNHYENILNFFDNRSTNASAESFNAKIKANSEVSPMSGISFSGSVASMPDHFLTQGFPGDPKKVGRPDGRPTLFKD